MNKINTVIKGLNKINPEEVNVYDSNESSPFFSFIVVATVSSVRQANKAIEYIKEALLEENLEIKSYEGYDSNWVLIDGFDFLIHIFTEEERNRVQIDKIYMNLNKIDINSIEA